MYFTYIVASRQRALYTGVTNDLTRRVFEHKGQAGSRFATKYNIDRLVYFEEFSDGHLAIAREKEIKGWRRSKKDSADRVDESRLAGSVLMA